MKQPKKLTRNQKECLGRHGLNWRERRIYQTKGDIRFCVINAVGIHTLNVWKHARSRKTEERDWRKDWIDMKRLLPYFLLMIGVSLTAVGVQILMGKRP